MKPEWGWNKDKEIIVTDGKLAHIFGDFNNSNSINQAKIFCLLWRIAKKLKVDTKMGAKPPKT